MLRFLVLIAMVLALSEAIPAGPWYNIGQRIKVTWSNDEVLKSMGRPLNPPNPRPQDRKGGRPLNPPAPRPQDRKGKEEKECSNTSGPLPCFCHFDPQLSDCVCACA